MAINLDPAQGASASLPGRLDRHDANARQDRWMFELEQAMFSASAKQQRVAVPQQQRPDSAAAARHSTGVAGADGRLADVDSPERAHAGLAALGARELDDTADAGTGGAAGVVALPATVHTVVWVQVSLTRPATAEGAGAIAPGRFASAAVSANRAADAGSNPASSVQAVQRATAAPLVRLGQAAEPLLPDNGAPAMSDSAIPGESDSGAATLADVAEFEKRLIHLVVGADGVHAYIRDAELGAAQLRGVAAALAAEMAAGGQALAALTVNGQRVSQASAHAPGDLAADGLAPVAGDEPAAPSRSFQLLMPVRKGLPE